ncbi:PspC domain-containing protein [Solitalea canadensis]|uniref:Putative stress-responsive transcriptional regulator n=1 Tax=Solitalea canadensis (strain ATCC 29591 / DSM 3403 / JCM 21819 / LMG 8368 / NBRC 15130 / NCIMB 12057 / USAM 9D) TaxID=929556 RepID=H8KS52_SOLCM|nr:PspC domain-containing protein [Solitalea canadensis]AFD07840.1 putative stress-responsive transcriptional regulator [Solitalea canadensis DSM 3403]
MEKRLYRNTDNKVISGVCSGLGEYFNLDPTIVRIIFLILFFGLGTGVLIYIILWVVMPEKPKMIE